MFVNRIFTTLSLAVLCLGGTSVAQAASVTGGASFLLEGTTPLTISVSAQSGPQGILRLGAPGGNQALCNVVDICVVGKAAIVAAQVQHSTIPDGDLPAGSVLYFAFVDNGTTGDVVAVLGVSDPGAPLVPCEELVDSLYFLLGVDPITSGNITVHP
jgi:hypothetical protein